MQHEAGDLYLSCLYVFLTQDTPCMYSHHPWRACASGPMEGATLQMHMQPLPNTAAVTCCSPLLCLLLLFVRWPFGVVSGSSVSRLSSLKWDQAKGCYLGSIILDRSIAFSRCLGLDNQARLGDVNCQFSLILLSREVGLAVFYQNWRGDAEPGTHCGTQLGQTAVRHSYRACKAEFDAFDGQQAGGKGYLWILPLPTLPGWWTPVQVKNSSWPHLEQLSCCPPAPDKQPPSLPP